LGFDIVEIVAGGKNINHTERKEGETEILPRQQQGGGKQEETHTKPKKSIRMDMFDDISKRICEETYPSGYVIFLDPCGYM
jgi:hypothetical protein